MFSGPVFVDEEMEPQRRLPCQEGGREVRGAQEFVSFVKLAPFAVLWSRDLSAHVGSKVVTAHHFKGCSEARGWGFLPSHSGATFLQLQSVRKTEPLPSTCAFLSVGGSSRAHTGRRATEAVTLVQLGFEGGALSNLKHFTI